MSIIFILTLWKHVRPQPLLELNSHNDMKNIGFNLFTGYYNIWDLRFSRRRVWSFRIFWDVAMASVWAGHGNHLSTPLKYVETPAKGVSCPNCPAQNNLGPLLVPSFLAHHSPASPQFPPSPYKGPISILSPSHTLPLSLSLSSTMEPPRLPLARFLAYRHPSPIGQTKFTWTADFCYTTILSSWWWRLYELLKHQSTSMWLHGDTSQKL
jgi:hypothetical protein